MGKYTPSLVECKYRNYEAECEVLKEDDEYKVDIVKLWDMEDGGVLVNPNEIAFTDWEEGLIQAAIEVYNER